MGRVKVISKVPLFMSKVDRTADQMLAKMAREIETIAKVKYVPVKESPLQSSIVHRRDGKLRWIVPAETEYAMAQEMGTNGKSTFRKYTKPGTGKGYLRKAGNDVKTKSKTYTQMFGRIKI